MNFQESTEKHTRFAIDVKELSDFWQNYMKNSAISARSVRKVPELQFGGEEGLNVFGLWYHVMSFCAMVFSILLVPNFVQGITILMLTITTINFPKKLLSSVNRVTIKL